MCVPIKKGSNCDDVPKFCSFAHIQTYQYKRNCICATNRIPRNKDNDLINNFCRCFCFPLRRSQAAAAAAITVRERGSQIDKMHFSSFFFYLLFAVFVVIVVVDICLCECVYNPVLCVMWTIEYTQFIQCMQWKRCLNEQLQCTRSLYELNVYNFCNETTMVRRKHTGHLNQSDCNRRLENHFSNGAFHLKLIDIDEARILAIY